MDGVEASFDEAHHFSHEKMKHQFFKGVHVLCAGNNGNLQCSCRDVIMKGH